MLTAQQRAVLDARTWLDSEDARQFSVDFGAPFYAWDEKHDELAYLYGREIVRIERSETGEGIGDVENKTHHFRNGDTPGSPLQYDSYEDGLAGAERTASAAPIYHALVLKPRQRRLRTFVQRVLEEMKPRYRDLLVARYVEGKTVDAIGDDIGITHQAVSARLKTAHRHFTQVVASMGEVDLRRIA